MNKLKYIRIQEQNNTYSGDIPIGVDAWNVDMESGSTLQDTIGDLDINISDNITEQLNDLYNNIDILSSEKVDIQDLPDGISSVVEGWLDDHVTPVGSAILVDDSLTQSGSAADAKVTGDELSLVNDNIDQIEDVLSLASPNPFIGNISNLKWNQGVIYSDGSYGKTATYGAYTDRILAYPGMKIDYIGNRTDITVALCQWFNDDTFSLEQLQVRTTGNRYTKILNEKIKYIAFTEYFGSTSGNTWTPTNARTDFKINVESALNIQINSIEETLENKIDTLTNDFNNQINQGYLESNIDIPYSSGYQDTVTVSGVDLTITAISKGVFKFKTNSAISSGSGGLYRLKTDGTLTSTEPTMIYTLKAGMPYEFTFDIDNTDTNEVINLQLNDINKQEIIYSFSSKKREYEYIPKEDTQIELRYRIKTGLVLNHTTTLSFREAIKSNIKLTKEVNNLNSQINQGYLEDNINIPYSSGYEDTVTVSGVDLTITAVEKGAFKFESSSAIPSGNGALYRLKTDGTLTSTEPTMIYTLKAGMPYEFVFDIDNTDTNEVLNLQLNNVDKQEIIYSFSSKKKFFTFTPEIDTHVELRYRVKTGLVFNHTLSFNFYEVIKSNVKLTKEVNSLNNQINQGYLEDSIDIPYSSSYEDTVEVSGVDLTITSISKGIFKFETSSAIPSGNGALYRLKNDGTLTSTEPTMIYTLKAGIPYKFVFDIDNTDTNELLNIQLNNLDKQELIYSFSSKKKEFIYTPESDTNVEIRYRIKPGLTLNHTLSFNFHEDIKSNVELTKEIDSYDYIDKVRKYTVKNMEQWRSLGMGLMIHWGVFAVLGGFYNNQYYTEFSGEGGSEWIFRRAKIPKETYKAYQSQLTGTNWDAEYIAKLAYNAGMKYVVITAKHHEGFVMYDSKYAEWCTKTAPIRNTVLDELKEACDKYGLKFGLYFSQNYDWYATGGFGQRNENNQDPYTTEEHQSYVQNQCNILKEIMDRYSPYTLWYDIPNPNDEYFKPILELQKTYYPNVVCNDRLSGTNYGDYGVGEENYFMGIRGGEREYAEACRTINGMWGYNRGKDLGEGGVSQQLENFRDTLKQRILETLPRGQNLLLNISPKLDGSISENQVKILERVSDFCTKYGTLFDTSPVSKKIMPNWGRMLKTKNNILKCYVYLSNISSFEVDGVLTKYAKKAYYYTTDGNRTECTLTKNSDDIMTISGYSAIDDSSSQVDRYAITRFAVIDIEFENTIVSNEINYFKNGDLIRSLAFNAHGYNLYISAPGNYPYIGTAENTWTAENYLQTEFIYTGTTGSYSLTFELNNTDTNTFTAEIINGNTTQTKNVAMTDEKTKTVSGVNFVSGQRYKIKITKDNTSAFKFQSVTIGS